MVTHSRGGCCLNSKGVNEQARTCTQVRGFPDGKPRSYLKVRSVLCPPRSTLSLAIVADGLPEPRGEENVGPADCCASGAARAGGTSPKVLSRVNASGACRGAIVSANVLDAGLAAEQIVEMDVDLSRSIHRDVDVFIPDHVLRNNGAIDR